MEITGAPVVLAPEKAKEALERFMEELSAMQDVSESRCSKRLP